MIEEIETPDLIGLTIKEAEKLVKENELELQIENKEETEIERENTIIKEQTPKAGIKINKKSKIYINI